MNVVEPIRDTDMVQKWYRVAREHDSRRRGGETCWELLLALGFGTSLRISDMVRLKVKDIRGRDYVEIKAQKTGKRHKIRINYQMKLELARLLRGRDDDEYVLQSVKRDVRTHGSKAISRQAAYDIIQNIARQSGHRDKVGCHTLRKTFGYHYYQQTKDEVSLQRILGHTARRDTMVYIGMVQEDIDEKLDSFSVLAPRR